MKNGIRTIAVIAALVAAAMVPALTLPDAGAREREPGRTVTGAELVESVRQILPSWDESLLRVPD